MCALILVAEDDAENLDAISSVLAGEGYRVIEARTGPAALAAARAEGPDAILLDLALPGMNGLDVAQHLACEPDTGSIPVIAISGSWMAEDRAWLAELGFTGALRKPFRAEGLLAELRRVLVGTAGSRKPEARSQG